MTARAEPDRDDALRRRRRDAVFGDVLPDSTRDERGEGGSRGEPGDNNSDVAERERDLLSDVPPHHG